MFLTLTRGRQGTMYRFEVILVVLHPTSLPTHWFEPEVVKQVERVGKLDEHNLKIGFDWQPRKYRWIVAV